jgi:FkbM family methyltransferase
MKNLINKILKQWDYKISKISNIHKSTGKMDICLEGLKSRGLICSTILDVGANKTNWSRMAKRIFPNAKFHLIEPQIEMKNNLDKFVNDYKDASYSLAGAGAETGSLVLTIWDDLAGSSFLPKSNSNLIDQGVQREVKIITIDDLISDGIIEIPSLIKLDIQGFELEALKGAKKTFGNTEVYILEVSLFSFSNVPGIPLFSDVINFMLERNYVVYDFPGFARRPLDNALGQCDICFVKKDGFLRKSNDWE